MAEVFDAVKPFLGKINSVILNPLITLLFAVAFLIFFWGIFQFISSQTTDKGREDGKKKIFYGILGMFIMFSAYGIIYLILNTFSIPARYPLTK